MTAHNFTEQELHFCGQYALTGNGKRSAIDAGFPEPSAANKASKLLKKDYIQEKIAELQDDANKELVENTNISRAYVVRWLIRMTEKAEKAGNHAAAINSLQWLGKSIGMFTEKVEHTHTQTIEEVFAQLPDVGPVAYAVAKQVLEGYPADDESIVRLVNATLAQAPADKPVEDDGQKRIEAPGSQSTH